MSKPFVGTVQFNQKDQKFSVLIWGKCDVFLTNFGIELVIVAIVKANGSFTP